MLSNNYMKPYNKQLWLTRLSLLSIKLACVFPAHPLCCSASPFECVRELRRRSQLMKAEFTFNLLLLVVVAALRSTNLSHRQ